MHSQRLLSSQRQLSTPTPRILPQAPQILLLLPRRNPLLSQLINPQPSTLSPKRPHLALRRHSHGRRFFFHRQRASLPIQIPDLDYASRAQVDLEDFVLPIHHVRDMGVWRGRETGAADPEFGDVVGWGQGWGG